VKVNKENVKFEDENSLMPYKNTYRDSPKANVWCELLHIHKLSPSLFAETTVASTNYMDMLEC
jgi:hypothetical protein